MAPLLIAGMVVVVMGLIIIPMAVMARAQSEALQSWLKSNLGLVGAVAALGVAASIDLAKWITHKLGENFEGIERLSVAWLATLYRYVELVGSMTLLWPLELFKVTYWLIWHEIPRMIKALPTKIEHVVHQVTKQLPGITKTIIRLPKLTKAQARALIGAAVATYITPYLSMLRWLRTHFHALTAVIPHTLPIPFGRTIAQIKKRLRRLERENVLSATAVAAVAFALTRLGLNWMRCNSFRRLGKRIGCGGFAFLEELLFIGFSAFVITDLCRFTDLLIKQAEKIRPVLLTLVDVEDALVNCHGTEKPIDFALPALSLPPMPGPSVMAA